MYIWKEFGGVDHLCDFQLNEIRRNRDTVESVYRKFHVCSYISILVYFLGPSIPGPFFSPPLRLWYLNLDVMLP